MVGISFVRKSLAIGGHSDDAWLGAVDEVRHYAFCAVLPRRDGNRDPSRGVRQTRVHLAPDLLRESQPVAGVTGWSWRVVLLPGRRVGEQFFSASDIMGEAAACEHYSALGVYLD